MKPDEPQQGSVDNWTYEEPPHPEPDMDGYYMRQEEHVGTKPNDVSNGRAFNEGAMLARRHVRIVLRGLGRVVSKLRRALWTANETERTV
jgi:hypothetical protein